MMLKLRERVIFLWVNHIVINKGLKNNTGLNKVKMYLLLIHKENT
jgi:hypothetical protein